MTETPTTVAPMTPRSPSSSSADGAAAELWQLDEQVVLIGAGDRIPVPGRGDRTYLFRAHSEYLYLTDRERPGGVLAFDCMRAGSTSSPQ